MDGIIEAAKHPSPSEGDQDPSKKFSRKAHLSAEEAVLLAREELREEAVECEESNEKWYLCSHDTKKSSNYWKYFAEFNPKHYIDLVKEERDEHLHTLIHHELQYSPPLELENDEKELDVGQDDHLLNF